jgi:hypothetical protein
MFLIEIYYHILETDLILSFYIDELNNFQKDIHIRLIMDEWRIRIMHTTILFLVWRFETIFLSVDRGTRQWKCGDIVPLVSRRFHSLCLSRTTLKWSVLTSITIRHSLYLATMMVLFLDDCVTYILYSLLINSIQTNKQIKLVFILSLSRSIYCSYSFWKMMNNNRLDSRWWFAAEQNSTTNTRSFRFLSVLIFSFVSSFSFFLCFSWLNGFIFDLFCVRAIN